MCTEIPLDLKAYLLRQNLRWILYVGFISFSKIALVSGRIFAGHTAWRFLYELELVITISSTLSAQRCVEYQMGGSKIWGVSCILKFPVTELWNCQLPYATNVLRQKHPCLCVWCATLLLLSVRDKLPMNEQLLWSCWIWTSLIHELFSGLLPGLDADPATRSL